MARRPYQEIFHGTARFSASTRKRLERAVGRMLSGHRTSASTMRSAVTSATHELLAEGLSPFATLEVLGAVVEDAGRACGADRSSLISGQPRWVPARTRVLSFAETELASLTVGAPGGGLLLAGV